MPEKTGTKEIHPAALVSLALTVARTLAASTGEKKSAAQRTGNPAQSGEVRWTNPEENGNTLPAGRVDTLEWQGEFTRR